MRGRCWLKLRRRIAVNNGIGESSLGGGELFRSLLEAGLVDRVETSLVPVLLGGGIPLLPPPTARTALKPRKQRVYEKTGTIALEYEPVRG